MAQKLDTVSGPNKLAFVTIKLTADTFSDWKQLYRNVCTWIQVDLKKADRLQGTWRAELWQQVAKLALWPQAQYLRVDRVWLREYVPSVKYRKRWSATLLRKSPSQLQLKPQCYQAMLDWLYLQAGEIEFQGDVLSELCNVSPPLWDDRQSDYSRFIQLASPAVGLWRDASIWHDMLGKLRVPRRVIFRDLSVCVHGVIGLAYYVLQQVEGMHYEGKLFQSG